MDELDEDCPEDDDTDGADLLSGGEGNDVLEGWLGSNRCSGGEGQNELRHCDP